MNQSIFILCSVLFVVLVGVGSSGSFAADYVGSTACKKCHLPVFNSWKQTFHSKMIQKKEDAMPSAVKSKWASDGTNPGPTTGNVSGKVFTINDVEYVVGSKWKQRFMVKEADGGGHQFLNKQFNVKSGLWENYGNKNTWETMCATCHVTGYRLTEYDPANPKAQKYTWSELSIGCEACHGAGAKHVASKSKKDIFTFSDKSKQEQARVCGYCHIRAENDQFKSIQGNAREDLPAPKVGESFNPGDDWTKWYPEHVILPGVQPEDKVDVEYEGDLKGAFIIDEISKANGVYEAGKHHEEYQELVQSKHFKDGILSCVDCHSAHAGKGGKAMKDSKAKCAECHDVSYTVAKFMPGTGKTADNLFVRSHAFVKNPRPGKTVISE